MTIKDWILQEQGKHLCRCGCNGMIVITPEHHKPSVGIPDFLQGHSNKGKNNPAYNKKIDKWVEQEQGKHFCHCGCNGAIIIKRWHFWVDIPNFIHGHSNKGEGNPFYKKHHTLKTIKVLSELQKGERGHNWGTHPAQQTLKKISKSQIERYKNNPMLIGKARERRLKMVFPFKDTKIEVALQNILVKNGIQFEKHKAIFGQPDIFIAPNICVFVDGGYWHADPREYKKTDIMKMGKTAMEIWDRDKKVNQKLLQTGYVVLRFWEKEINTDINDCFQKIKDAMGKEEKCIFVNTAR